MSEWILKNCSQNLQKNVIFHKKFFYISEWLKQYVTIYISIMNLILLFRGTGQKNPIKTLKMNDEIKPQAFSIFKSIKCLFKSAFCFFCSNWFIRCCIIWRIKSSFFNSFNDHYWFVEVSFRPFVFSFSDEDWKISDWLFHIIEKIDEDNDQIFITTIVFVSWIIIELHFKKIINICVQTRVYYCSPKD